MIDSKGGDEDRNGLEGKIPSVTDIKGRKPPKTYFLDTNLLLLNADCIFEFANSPENEVIITDVNIKEIDQNKRRPGEIGYQARQASRHLQRLQKKGSLLEGVATREGGLVKVLSFSGNGKCVEEPPPLKFNVDLGQGDNQQTVGVIKFASQNPKMDIRFVTNDELLCLTMQINGIHAEPRKGMDPTNLNRGYCLVVDEQMRLYKKVLSTGGPRNPYQGSCLDVRKIGEDWVKFLVPNQYVIFVKPEMERIMRLDEDIDSSLKIPPQKHIYRFDALHRQLVPIKSSEKVEIYGIRPWNLEQFLSFDLLQSDLPGVALVGKAGCGKTLIALAYALYKTIGRRKLLEHKKDDESAEILKIMPPKIFIERRIVPVDQEEIGTLPGGLIKKQTLYYKAIEDNLKVLLCNSSALQKDLVYDKNKPFSLFGMLNMTDVLIEILPIGTARGITVNENEILSMEEAQNLTPSTVRTMGTRIGKGQVILNGDPTQVDNEKCYGYDGLTHFIHRIATVKDPRYFDCYGAIVFRHDKRSKFSAFAEKYL